MYRDSGVRANAIAPGGTATGISTTPDPAGHGPRVVGRYLHNVGRIAQAEEQAAAIVFLASDAASNITGVVLPVDNGWSAV
jgi:NAD(P)-dependent dehydrogenase (short-subunit alcohol dehydrogenase family)